MPANLENSAVDTGLEKVSFHSNPKARQCQRMFRTTTLISHASKCSKFSKWGFNSTWTEKFQMFQLDLGKAEEPEIKLPNTLHHQKSKRVPEKHLLLLYWLCQSLWLCRSQKNWKILKEMRIPDHLTCLLRNLYAGQEATVRTGQGTTD